MNSAGTQTSAVQGPHPCSNLLRSGLHKSTWQRGAQLCPRVHSQPYTAGERWDKPQTAPAPLGAQAQKSAFKTTGAHHQSESLGKHAATPLSLAFKCATLAFAKTGHSGVPPPGALVELLPRLGACTHTQIRLLCQHAASLRLPALQHLVLLHTDCHCPGSHLQLLPYKICLQNASHTDHTSLHRKP